MFIHDLHLRTLVIHAREWSFCRKGPLNPTRRRSFPQTFRIMKKPHDFVEKLHKHDPFSKMTDAKIKKLKYFTSKDLGL